MSAESRLPLDLLCRRLRASLERARQRVSSRAWSSAALPEPRPLEAVGQPAPRAGASLSPLDRAKGVVINRWLPRLNLTSHNNLRRAIVERDQVRAQLDQLSSALGAVQADRDALRLFLSQELADRELELDELRQALRQRELDLELLHRQLDQRADELAQLQLDADRRATELEALRQELLCLHEQLRERQQRVEQLQATLDWRARPEAAATDPTERAEQPAEGELGALLSLLAARGRTIVALQQELRERARTPAPPIDGAAARASRGASRQPTDPLPTTPAGDL